MLKKALFSVTAVLLFGAACLSYSCSADYNEPQQMVKTSQEQTEEEILAELIEFNKSLKSAVESRDLTKRQWASLIVTDGWWAYKGAKRGGKIGSYFGPKGTIIGGIAGGAIFGATASYIHYNKRFEVDVAGKEFDSNYQEIKEPSKAEFSYSFAIAEKSIVSEDYSIGLAFELDSTSVKIGILHNKILDIVDNNNTITGPGMITQLDSLETAIINHPEFNEVYDSIPYDYYYTNEPTELCDKIMYKFFEAVETSCSSKEDLDYIIKYYKSVINKSQSLNKYHNPNPISKTEKKEMYTGMAVTAYSYDYWNNN
ncbi:MAG: hypothetical protein HDR46_03150 [Bacteroides sp.]|nr:hypothetical protein [Bacteroides sp.]